MSIQNIAVIGAGTMGNGIAHVFAQHNYHVKLMDVEPENLVKAVATITKNLDRMIKKEKITIAQKESTLERITSCTNMETALEDTELVIEAATENPKIKYDIFTKLDALAAPECLLMSNTSSISITSIAAQTRRPELVAGMHFMNPVPIMPLVELIKGYSTRDDVMETISDITRSLHKTPIVVNDYPGFAANRILVPMINEAIIALQEGVATVEAIDQVMKLGMAHPMGPLQLADFVGLDVVFSICNVLYEGLGNPKYAPAPLLRKMVTAGKLGVKSGEGFYDYSHGGKELIVSAAFQ